MKIEKSYYILPVGEGEFGISDSGEVVKKTGLSLTVYEGGMVRLGKYGKFPLSYLKKVKTEELLEIVPPGYKRKNWEEFKRTKYPLHAMRGDAVVFFVMGLEVVMDFTVYERYCTDDRYGSLVISFSGRDRMDDYVMVSVRGTGRSVYFHTLLVRKQEGQVVDHINGNRRDNRVENLRACSHRENCNNKHPETRYKELL